jgi:hypothetical protein
MRACLDHSMRAEGLSHMKWACLLLLAGLTVACSSEQNLGTGSGPDNSATAGLDGTWDVTFTNHHFFNAGVVTVAAGTVQATFARNDQGSQFAPGCRITTSSEEIDVAFAAGGWAVATNTSLDRVDGAGCPSYLSPGTLRSTLSSDREVAQRTSAGPSIFGGLGGAWTLGGPSTMCNIVLSNTLFTGACSGNSSFHATLSGSNIAGQGTDGFEFAAHRR